MSSKKSVDQIICRICLSELDPEEEEANPIISPCHCNGTMKYIHTECLKQWLSSKGITNRRNEADGAISYIWKSLDCELCKTKFPDFVFVGERKINLIDIEKPKGPYIILENMSNNGTRAIHVLGMSGREYVKIGRGHDSDVRIGDISVSRLHAIIKKGTYNNFFIEDCNSKFGTLVQAKYPVKVGDSPVSFQIGRSIFVLEKPQSCSCCNLFSCFNLKGSKNRAGLVTTNGLHYFPKEYLDRQNLNKLTISEDCMSDCYRDVNMIMQNRDPQQRFSDIGSNRQISNEGEQEHSRDSDLAFGMNQFENNDRLNRIIEENEPESSKNNENESAHTPINQSYCPPQNSRLDLAIRGEDVEKSISSMHNSSSPKIGPQNQPPLMTHTFTHGFIEHNNINSKKACNMQENEVSVSLSNHILSNSELSKPDQKFKLPVLQNNMFDEPSSGIKEPVIPYHQYRGSAELIKSSDKHHKASQNLNSKCRNGTRNQLETNFSKSVENFKSIAPIGKDEKAEKQTNIIQESRRTHGFNMENVRRYLLQDDINHNEILEHSDRNPLEESKNETYRSETNASIVEDLLPVTSTRNNQNLNLMRRQNTAKTILEEESKNISCDKTQRELYEQKVQKKPNNLQMSVQDRTAYVPSPAILQSLNDKSKEGKSSEQMSEPKQPMFPDLVKSKEFKAGTIDELQKDLAGIDISPSKTEQGPTPIVDKSTKFRIAKTVTQELAPVASLIEEQEKLMNDVKPKQDNLVLEKSIIESNELMESMAPKPKNETENTKLRKLKSKKLRRRRKVSKPRYRNVINFFSKK